jgi:hypothetical protein
MTARRNRQTFVLDLGQPIDALDARLHKEWRYGKNRFQREGGTVQETNTDAALDALARMLSAVVGRKGFNAYGGPSFPKTVAKAFWQQQRGLCSAHVFTAESGGVVLAVALVCRTGNIAHLMWTASDYGERKKRAAEGLQWGIVNMLRQQGIRYYDLGGADPERNPGVFLFKQRLGGELVNLGRVYYSVLC